MHFKSNLSESNVKNLEVGDLWLLSVFVTGRDSFSPSGSAFHKILLQLISKRAAEGAAPPHMKVGSLVPSLDSLRTFATTPSVPLAFVGKIGTPAVSPRAATNAAVAAANFTDKGSSFKDDILLKTVVTPPVRAGKERIRQRGNLYLYSSFANVSRILIQVLLQGFSEFATFFEPLSSRITDTRCP